MYRILMMLVVAMSATSLLADDATYIWGRDQRGMQAGARLLSVSGKLQPGDPIVVEFVLKNTSEEPQTLVVQQYDDTYPTLGADHRIELNILGSSQRKWQHKLAPGEILRKRQYRVTVSTEGFPPGDYHVTAGSAFWLSSGQNRGTGVSHGRPIPVTIGDPEAARLAQPPQDEDPAKAIHWGGPVAELIVGARFPQGKTAWKNGEDVQADLFLFNASAKPIHVRYEMPASPAEWNLHLTHESKQYVRLDYTWFTGASPHITRQVTVDPGEPLQITGIDAEVSVGGTLQKQRIGSPAVRLLKEKVDYQPGEPKRLIGGQGNYEFKAAITMHRPDIPDVSMVLSAGALPFQVQP